MANIGHSRLLKILQEHRSNMAETVKIKFEFKNQENIESEVPETQQLRDGGPIDDDEGATPNNVATVENGEAPVRIIENVFKAVNPLYSDIQSEVVKGPQPLRIPKYNVREENKENGHDDRHPVEKKVKTKIPILKFKQSVEKINEKKRKDEKEHETPPIQERRSSIPRLVKENKITPVEITERKVETEQDAGDKTVDEFDKIYEEIVDKEPEEAELRVHDLLDTNLEDPEVLETSFDEIVHEYEEHREPVNVEQSKQSKIPLLKRKSEHEIEIPKQERKHSLKKSISYDKPVNKPVKKDSPSYKDEFKSTRLLKNLPKSSSVEEPKGVLKHSQNNLPPNRVSNIPVKEKLKAVKPTPKEHLNSKDGKFKVADEEEINVILKDIDNLDEGIDEVDTTDNTLEPELNNVHVVETKNDKVIVDNENKEFDLSKITLRQKTRPSLTERLFDKVKSVHEDDQEIKNSKINKEPETTHNLKPKDIEKISIKEVKKPEINNTPVDIKEKVKVATPTFKEHLLTTKDKKDYKYVTPPKIEPPPNEDTSHSEIDIIQVTDNLETADNSVDSLPINSEQVNNENSFTDTNSVNENDNNDLPTKSEPDTVNSYNELPVIKGKVSRILNRIASIENQPPETPKKEVAVEIPRKKSVLSKIAMFENVPKESSPKPRPIIKPINNKTEDNSEVLQRKPIIVDEVLKTPLRTTDANNRIQIEIPEDIPKKPNKIEEQVIVQENLKEEMVIYEKFEIVEPVDSGYITTDIKDTPNTENTSEEINENNEDDLINNENFKPVVDEVQVKADNDDEVFTKTDKNSNHLVENRLKWIKHRQNSHNESTRKKSVAEMDLGDAVKGKVQNMVVRMNSSENLLDIDRREINKPIINARERPRQRTVSDRIALFERKFTPVDVEDRTPVTVRNQTKIATTIMPQLTENDYNTRINELKNARTKYGKANMSYIQLKNGNKMPVIALGTALMDPRLIFHVIGAAIDLGYRAFDTAFIYGNEKEAGEAIRTKIEDGTVKREELFIMSKLWSTFHRRDLVEQACKNTLSAMGLEYLDLYLIHNPMSMKEGKEVLPKIAGVLQYSEHDYLEAWYGMETLVEQGLVRNIGVSNFNSEQVARVVDKGRIKPVINQVECHPYLSQHRLQEFCAERDVRMSCYGVLGSKGTLAELKSHQSPVIDDPLVAVMAAGLGVTPAQLLIRYQIENGRNTVVKASTASHLHENLQALDISLEQHQLDALDALSRGKRTFTFQGMGDTHKNYPFKIPF